jgi:hypothetical protein
MTGSDMTALTSANRMPIRLINPESSGPAGNTNSGVILLGSVDPIRELIVGCYMVKLCRRLIILPGPRNSSIITHICSSIVGVYHPLWISGIDPEVVIIPMGDPDRSVGLAPVNRAVKTCVENIDCFLVFRVSINPRVIKSPLSKPAFRIDSPPGLPPIFRAENTSLLGLYDSPDTLRVGWRDCDSDLP